MAGELVSGYLRLIPTVEGIQGATARALVPATREADKAGKTAGRRFGSAFSLSSKKLLLGGALVAGIAAGAKALGQFTRNAALDEAGQRRLARALGNTTKATKKQVAGVEDWISAQGVALGVTDDELRPSFQRLVQATGDIGKAQKLAKVAMDASAGSGKSLETVSTALAKAQNGNLGALSRLGLKIKDAAGKTLSFTQAVREMARTFGGQARDRAQAFEGQMARFQLVMDETKEAIGSRLLPILTTLGGWFLDKGLPAVQKFADGISNTLGPAYTTLRDTIRNSPLAQSIKTGLSGALEDAGASLDTLRDKFAGFDFSNLDGKKLGLAITTALGVAIKGLGSLGAKLAAAVGKMLKNVDWVGLGIKAGPAVIGLALGLATGILNGITDPGLWKSIIDHLPQILLAAVTIAFAPAKLLGPIAKIFGKIPFVGKFIEGALKGLNTAGGKITSSLGRLVRAAGREFAEAFGRIPIPGARLVARAISSIRDLGPRLKSLWGTIKTGIGVAVLEWSARMGAGLRSLIDKAVSTMKTIGSRIKGALGDAKNLLFKIGSSIVQGLIDGLLDKLKDVIAAAKKLGAAIKNNKGPESADRVMLFPAGRLIVSGLIRGIEVETGSLLRTLAGVNSAIESSIEPKTSTSRLAVETARQARAAQALVASAAQPSGDGLTRADLEWHVRQLAALMGLATNAAISDQLAFSGSVGRMG